ncbi:helix-hairpin-helix domain-containing protein [Acidobacteria bacterium AH-259-O06]|nr:helix-hairpin-helix domain-containing protein [Acidobacteria bacterium AH-259-O06]
MKVTLSTWGAALAVLMLLLCVSVARAEQVKKINLNTATSVELDSLPGIGPVLAGRILQFRKINGPFKRTEDLMNVRGIGEKKFLKLKDRIRVEPPSKKNTKPAKES